jgi:hypothetical protein
MSRPSSLEMSPLVIENFERGYAERKRCRGGRLARNGHHLTLLVKGLAPILAPMMRGRPAAPGVNLHLGPGSAQDIAIFGMQQGAEGPASIEIGGPGRFSTAARNGRA